MEAGGLGPRAAAAARRALNRVATALRHRAAVAALALEGHERVLEIGCGSGVATGLLLAALPAGGVVALDRSLAMIAVLRQGLSEHILAGRLEAVAEPLEATSLGQGQFDRILAVNVDFNRRLGERWPALLQPLLRPGGRVVLAMEAPPGSDKGAEFAARCRELLERAGFGADARAVREGKAEVWLVEGRRPPG